jgi:hypothetical protein
MPVMSDAEIQPESPVVTPEPEATSEPAEPPKVAPPPKPRAKPKAPPAESQQADEPAAPPPPAEDPLKIALRDLQGRHDDATVKLRAESDLRAKLDRENKTLREQVEKFGQREREGAILARMRDALPHLSTLEVRGALAALAEDGKVDRYSTDADAASKAALEALKAAAPNLLRVPAPGGGPAGAPAQPAGPARAKSRAPY